jgi:flagellar motor switch protein FliM
MSESLSPAEVEALLRGVSDGDVAVADEQPRGAIRPYDLFGEERLNTRRFPGLDLVHEDFARRLRASLARFTGSAPTMQVGAIEILKFDTFRNRLPAGASLHLFTVLPLRGQSLLAFSAPLAFGLVDHVCGGGGRMPAEIEAREYSPIETQVLQRIVKVALGDLAESWARVQRVECNFVRSELNPAYVVLTKPDEMVLARELQCDLGSGPAALVLAVPYAQIEPLRAKLGEAHVVLAAGTQQDCVAATAAAVHQSGVTLSAELGTCEISARTLLGLRVGDVLGLATRGDDPVTLRVEGVPLMTGLAGVSRGQNAVRVLAHMPRE